MSPLATSDPGAAVGIICGGGVLPFAVADALMHRGRQPVLFAIRGAAEPARVAAYPHHWIALGQFGRFMRLARGAGCRDIVCVGALVRPALREVRLDWLTLRELPKIMAAFRGGDDHLLSAIGEGFERHGFHLADIRSLAPEVMLPQGALSRREPDAAALADIAFGLEALDAMSAFDVGQALVVIGRHIVAVEDIEGTDGLLARVARLRAEGRLRAPVGSGVLVKAPKARQDMRLDLPTLGPRTIAGVAAAGLAGIAVIAGNTLMAEPERMVAEADREGLFVVGLPPREAAT
ncbi:MAG: LpxI family protein [Xanthobacteraceae bacterium]|nr:MAG: LpxI family protein [Xanthobacteraceae bacterium]